MTDQQLRSFLLYTASACAAAGIFYLCVRYVLWWALPFLLAFAVAARIEPVIRRLQERFHFRRSFSALVLTLFLLFLLGGLASLLGSTLLGEASDLLARAPRLLAQAPAAFSALLQHIERYCAACPPWLRTYLESALASGATQAEDLLSTLSARALQRVGALAGALPGAALWCATAVLALYFTASSYPALRAAAYRRLSGRAMRSLRIFRSGVSGSLARWLRAQAVIGGVTFLQLLLVFLLLRQSYALLLSLLITLVDALPVFGTGTVLIPWALGELLLGSTPKAVALSALYLCTQLVRNALDASLLSAQAGLPPIASLAAMYLGFRAFGVGGMILLPFLLLLGAQVLHLARAQR